jgi:hypothetical protein
VSPFDGERVLGSVRFAGARLDGKPATIVIRADLAGSASGVLADHAPVDIRIDRLDSSGVQVGTTPDVDQKPIWITEWNPSGSSFWNGKPWYFEYDTRGRIGGNLNRADPAGAYRPWTARRPSGYSIEISSKSCEGRRRP